MQRSSSIVKLSGYFSRSGQGLSAADDVDAMRRAGGRAEEAGHALHAALLVLVQPMHAAIDQRVADLGLLVGKADRHLRADQVLGRGLQPLQKQRQVHPARQAQLGLFDPVDVRVGGVHEGSGSGFRVRLSMLLSGRGTLASRDQY